MSRFAVYVEIDEQSVETSVFWDIMPCKPLQGTQHFGGTCRLNLDVGYMLGSLDPEDGGGIILRNVG
jgi:hypothetical protein